MSEGLLVINAGSSSIKFAVFALADSAGEVEPVCHGLIENLGEQARFSATGRAGIALPMERPLGRDGEPYGHEQALNDLLAWLRKTHGLPEVKAVGHRVVHGGVRFSAPQPISTAVLAYLEELVPLAPLHQPHNLAAIRAVAAAAPEMPQVACFDTAFHRTQPELARLFALPREYWDAGVQRYGFHGLSYEYIASRLPRVLGERARGRVVVAHLGNGASMCAIKDLESIASTMGFTALEGLPMGTRTGSLDPGVILYLIEECGMGVAELTKLLYRRSGLLGLSGLSNDMRELLASEAPAARQAVDYFAYRIVRELGSLTAALGGLDALVFTAGIGEHAAPVRERVCAQAQWQGIVMDREANARDDLWISRADSGVAVLVIPTNEELVIARHVRRLVMDAA